MITPAYAEKFVSSPALFRMKVTLLTYSSVYISDAFITAALYSA